MTFPTRTDVQFFQSKQRLPNWTNAVPIGAGDRKYQSERLRTLIDDVVNSHAGIYPSAERHMEEP